MGGDGGAGAAGGRQPGLAAGEQGRRRAGVWQQHGPPHLGCWWLQVLLLLTALQPAIFSILANNGNIACSPPFSSKARSQRKSGDGRAALRAPS